MLKFLGVKTHFVLDEPKPYQSAIRLTEKLCDCDTPRDMLDLLSSIFQALKSTVVDYHQGRVELEAMDDVLPLTIYCVALACNLKRAVSAHQMMEDYCAVCESETSGYNFEQKLLCNFECGLRYIALDFAAERNE